MFVGGPGVARGYLNRPELTAERFIPNPFGAGRLYRTGDRARWSPGQGFIFEGRTDDQVKVRGFRIELGEIQAALTDHELVADAVVLAFARPGEGTRLAAYVVPRSSGIDSAALRVELRAALQARLPDTWCRPRSWCSTSFRSPPMASSTAMRCPPRSPFV